MSSLFDNLSEELFQILKGSGKTLTLYGVDGNKTYEPRDARRVFATPDNIMVSVVEAGSDSEVKLYLSQSTDVKAISTLINTLRQVTTRYNVLFNVRKYGKELRPRDFAYQASMTESSMWGSTKTSYQRIGTTKLIVRHCRPVSEGVIGARGRNILSMFVETAHGERFKFPENHLSAGRAFAQHINQNGKPHDVTGTQLVQLAQESLSLARVNRYIQHSRGFLGEQALALRPTIRNRLVELRRAFLSMSRPRGYHGTKDNLPTTTADLNESTSDRLSELQDILMIDSNHALAESLMPVALLKMGEDMTSTNNLFYGHLCMEGDSPDRLQEALLNEYGLSEDAWTRVNHNFFFNEAEAFEAAQEYARLTEAGYLVYEAEDAIANYAMQWTQHRHSHSGNMAFDDPKDRRDFNKGIEELTQGLRSIISGDIQTPDYPMRAPGFSDQGARNRFYLDLYVSQHKLENVATLNYVSTIIDKMAENQKLDGAEKTVAGKLIQALEDDLNGGEVDEAYHRGFINDEDPYNDGVEGYEAQLETIRDQFDVQEFVKDIYPNVLDGDDKDVALDKKYAMDALDGHFAYWMDQEGFTAHKGQFGSWAEELFPHVKEFCEQHGYHFDEAVKEFAEMEDQPGHHGIAAGDNVATDMGAAQVISVEGDIAHVEFLHGGTKALHVDDMDKMPKLGGVAEEAELAEWFDSFDPKAILGELAAPKDPYDQGVIARNSKMSRETSPYAQNSQEGQAWLRGFYGMSHPFEVDEDRVDELSKSKVQSYLDKTPQSKGLTIDDEEEYLKRRPGKKAAGDKTHGRAKVPATEAELNELSTKKVGDYFGKAAGDRARAERGAAHGDEKAELRLARRDAGLGRAFKKMREDDEVIGGDQGEDLIQDVKQDHGDEAFREELERVLKNARFRM